MYIIYRVYIRQQPTCVGGIWIAAADAAMGIAMCLSWIPWTLRCILAFSNYSAKTFVIAARIFYRLRVLVLKKMVGCAFFVLFMFECLWVCACWSRDEDSGNELCWHCRYTAADVYRCIMCMCSDWCAYASPLYNSMWKRRCDNVVLCIWTCGWSTWLTTLMSVINVLHWNPNHNDKRVDDLRLWQHFRITTTNMRTSQHEPSRWGDAATLRLFTLTWLDAHGMRARDLQFIRQAGCPLHQKRWAWIVREHQVHITSLQGLFTAPKAIDFDYSRQSSTCSVSAKQVAYISWGQVLVWYVLPRSMMEH